MANFAMMILALAVFSNRSDQLLYQQDIRVDGVARTRNRGSFGFSSFSAPYCSINSTVNGTEEERPQFATNKTLGEYPIALFSGNTAPTTWIVIESDAGVQLIK